MEREEIKDIIKEALKETFFSEEGYAPFNSLADKFEDYMKNIDKLNMMINEFKGLVAIVRGETRVQK